MIGNKLVITAAVLGALLATPVSASTVDVYTVGASGSPALDPIGNVIGGIPSISWNHSVSSLGGQYLLSIIAEGIDTGEIDKVYFNNTYIGDLTNQGFYSSVFNLNPGAGALAGITALTNSVFDVTAFVLLGVNTVRVDVDPNNWVNEIETATLSSVPLPGALPLLAGALGAFGIVRSRSKRKTLQA